MSTEFLPKLSAVLMLGDCAMKAKKELNIQIGERIKRAREKGGMTQEQFAELINKTPQFVSDLERGVSGISIETLRTICEKLCISSDSILFARRDENDVSELTSKFRKMSHVKFRALEQIVNALLYTEAEIGSDQ
jgi:transcriptional regulator with XRE-family HTH domain